MPQTHSWGAIPRQHGRHACKDAASNSHHPSKRLQHATANTPAQPARRLLHALALLSPRIQKLCTQTSTTAPLSLTSLLLQLCGLTAPGVCLGCGIGP